MAVMVRNVATAIVLAFCLSGAAWLRAAPPELCRVHGGNTKTIWGVGFEPGKTEVLAWSPPFDKEKAIAALEATPYQPLGRLPARPPEEAKRLMIFDIEPRGLVMAVEFYRHFHAGGFYDARAGDTVCWVTNGDGCSKPWLVRSARPWWVYPEKAAPGDRIRIFGRNIDAQQVALKSRGDGRVVVPSEIGQGRHPIYECWALLPSDLPAGEYDLFVHNGAGAEAGWGGPLLLTVEPKPEPPRALIDVCDLGAKGNGFDDDTAALRQALVKAGEAGGGVVHLPPGRYAISATLWVPSGVRLQGAGRANSIITVSESRPMRFDLPQEIERAMPGHWVHPPKQRNEGVMLWVRDHASVTDLGLESGPGVWLGVLAAHSGATIRRCNLRIADGDMQAIQVSWGSYGFTLKDCDILGHGGLFMMHGPHRQAYVGGNTFRCLTPGESNNLFIRAPQGCVIENNVLENADRNWVSQLGLKGARLGNPANSAYHTILQGNVLRNNIPRRHNSGENMYEAPGAFWHGRVVKADLTSITVAGEPFAADMSDTFVLVLDGRGLGQYRRVVANTKDTLTVEPAWDVVPNESTYVTVNGAYVETLWIDNTEEHTANWTGFWGFNLGHVVDGHVLRDGEGLYLWAWQRDNPSPVAFCDIVGSRVIGRGQIVLRGPLVFGNTVRFSEVVDFRYRPSLHIQPAWLQGMDPKQRFAIQLEPPQHQIEGLPATAALKDWNVIEGTHVCDGPQGIHVAAEADHNVLSNNAIHVDGEAIVNEPETTLFR